MIDITAAVIVSQSCCFRFLYKKNYDDRTHDQQSGKNQKKKIGRGNKSFITLDIIFTNNIPAIERKFIGEGRTKCRKEKPN